MDDRQTGREGGAAAPAANAGTDGAQTGQPGMEAMPGMVGLAGGAAAAQPGKLRALGTWCMLAMVLAALAGAGVLMWRSLQADKAIALVARSAMPAQEAAALAPAPHDVPGAPAAQEAVALTSVPRGVQDVPAAPDAATAAAAPMLHAKSPPVASAGKADAVAPQARAKPLAQARVAMVKPGQRVLAAKRAAVRAKRSVAGTAAPVRRVKTAPATRKPVVASVQRRLDVCREKAGEAAAACFARACRSYARNAPICVNDERMRRR